jgi:UV DNA damage endonuclease
MPASYAQAPWIEIEAKLKEEAIAGLQDWMAVRSGQAAVQLG